MKYLSSLYILDINALVGIWLASIFFHSVLLCCWCVRLTPKSTFAQTRVVSFPLCLFQGGLQLHVRGLESLTQFQLLFVFGMRSASNNLRVDIWISQLHLLKGFFCPLCPFFVTNRLTTSVWLYF